MSDHQSADYLRGLEDAANMLTEMWGNTISCNRSHNRELRELVAAIRALPVPALSTEGAGSARAVKVKKLKWNRIGDDYYAKGHDARVSSYEGKWAGHPKDWPPFDGYPYNSAEEAMAAEQASYEAYILAALEASDAE